VKLHLVGGHERHAMCSKEVAAVLVILRSPRAMALVTQESHNFMPGGPVSKKLCL
jgi:hypothetical protein